MGIDKIKILRKFQYLYSYSFLNYDKIRKSQLEKSSEYAML